MALIGTLRNKMGKIVVGAIMLTMLAFIGTDLIGNSTLLGGGTEPDIAEIAGTSITNSEFQAKVDELSYYFALNAGRNPLQQETEQIRNQAWNALILQYAYEPQFEELGIEVTNAELVDMVQGNNISPQIRQFFADPNTGAFSKENITGFLASISQASPQQQNSWIAFENSLLPSRKIDKYMRLLDLTNYANKHEAKEQYVNQTASASIDYLYVPFLSVNDSLVSFTDADLKKYIDENESDFQTEESRSFRYVVFDVIPSGYDSAVVKEEIDQLLVEIMETTNDSSFASINSDDQFPYVTYTDDNLPDSLIGKSVGYVSAPTISIDAYEFYKLSNIAFENTDSTKYKVSKIRKEFFVSDETINEAYRAADMFAASVGNEEEFVKEASERGLRILDAKKVNKNDTRVSSLQEARSLVIWLYNEASAGEISEVKEVDENYVVAIMTDEQDAGVADLEEVRNKVERLVKNEKKAEIVLDKFKSIEAGDLASMSDAYGTGTRSGSADFTLNDNNLSGVGFAPEAIGVSQLLDEEEVTKPFRVQDGVLVLKLNSKDIPVDLEDYSQYAQAVTSTRVGQRTVIADFPLSFFRVIVSRDADDSFKEFAEIEDLRYKFF